MKKETILKINRVRRKRVSCIELKFFNIMENFKWWCKEAKQGRRGWGKNIENISLKLYESLDQ